MKYFFNSIKSRIYNLVIINNFKILNKKLFHKVKNSEGVILIEFNAFPSRHPFLSLIANFVSKKFNYEIKAFDNYILSTKSFNSSCLESFKWFLGKTLSLKTWGIYRSFGVTEFIKPHKLKVFEIEKILDSIFFDLKTKDDIFYIKYKEVIVGDLIYDGYLKLYSLHTIQLNDPKFRNYVKNFIILANYWDDYFFKSNIKYIFVCHPYYSYALILRVGLLHKINCYCVGSGNLIRITSDRIFGSLQYLDYKKNYDKLSEQQKEKAISLSKISLDSRFSGKLGPVINDITQTRSSYHNNYDSSKLILKKNSKIKILICTHQIRDCVYAFGKNLFPDFYEWLIFLFEISKETNYDWYIKDHPPYEKLKYIKSQKETYRSTKELLKKYNNITYIEPTVSHNQIIKNGIDFVFTIYGSVGYEYAYNNIPVLTATPNSPYSLSNFTVNSDTIEDYKYKIKNLYKFKIQINQQEVIIFNYINAIFYDQNSIFEEFMSFLLDDQSNTFDTYDTYKFYDYWIKKINEKKLKNMHDVLENFFQSKDYALNLSHNQQRLLKTLG